MIGDIKGYVEDSGEGRWRVKEAGNLQEAERIIQNLRKKYLLY